MAAAEILAVGDTAATSGEVELIDNSGVVFGLKGVTGPNASVWIEVKDETGTWNSAGPNDRLTSAAPVWICYAAPSTIRFRRDAGGTCGVFRAA